MNPKNPEYALAGVRALARSIYPRHNLENHILPAVRIAMELAGQLSADPTIVEAATYLHDVGRIWFVHRFHERVGYWFSRALLPVLGFTREQTDAISRCILVHSATTASGFGSLEAEIVANADAVAQFDNFLYMFAIHYCNHGKDVEKTKTWLRGKYERAWRTKLTLETARNRVAGEYEGIKKALVEKQTRS